MFDMMYTDDDSMLLQNADIFLPDYTASRPGILFYLWQPRYIFSLMLLFGVEVFKRRHIERL